MSRSGAERRDGVNTLEHTWEAECVVGDHYCFTQRWRDGVNILEYIWEAEHRGTTIVIPSRAGFVDGFDSSVGRTVNFPFALTTTSCVSMLPASMTSESECPWFRETKAPPAAQQCHETVS